MNLQFMLATFGKSNDIQKKLIRKSFPLVNLIHLLPATKASIGSYGMLRLNKSFSFDKLHEKVV